MNYLDDKDTNDSFWWELMPNYPDLMEGLDDLEFSHDPEAGVVAAVGVFTLLKLRFWHHLPGTASDTLSDTHRTDDSLPPQAAKTL